MRIRIRRFHNEVQETQPADSQAVIVAVRTEGYKDCKPFVRILWEFI